MTTKLKSPTPRKHPRAIEPIDYGFTEVIFLSPSKPLRIPFDRVLESRTSCRRFGGKLSPSELGPLLDLVARKRNRLGPLGRPDWQSRPYPSAGGCHEIDLLLLNVRGHEDVAFIYDADHHALGALPGVNGKKTRAFVQALDDVVPAGNATLVWFVADVRRIAACYERWESLLWRDSGSAGVTLVLAATALGYASCLLGPHAPAAMKSMLPFDKVLMGVGGCVLGRRG